jgi:hypothetical protein
MGMHRAPELKALGGLEPVSENAEAHVTFEQAVEVT